MTDESFTALLDAAATAPVPDPSPGFVDRLDADLRIGHADAAAAPAARADGRALRRAALLWAAAGLVVAVLVVSQLRATDSGGLVLLDGEQVSVVLADGREQPVSPGDEIPDGATVTVGPGGFADFDGLSLGPGTVARFTDGRIEIEPDASPPAGDGDAGAPTRPRIEPERASGDRARPTPTTAPPAERTDRTSEPTTAGVPVPPDRVRRPGSRVDGPAAEREEPQTTTTVPRRSDRRTDRRHRTGQ